MKPISIGLDDNNLLDNKLDNKSNNTVNEKRVDDFSWFLIDNLPSRTKGVYGRPLTYREVKRIAYANENTIDEILLDIASKAIRFTSGLTDIYDADLRYLFLWLRAVTLLDSKFDMYFTCTNDECGKESSFSLYAEDIIFNQLDASLNPTGESLSVGGKEIIISLPYAKKVIESKNIIKLYSDYESIEVDAYVASCVTVPGLNTVQEVFEWIDTLSPLDVLKIHNVVKKYDCGTIEMVVKKCVHCGKESKIALDIPTIFFFPTI